MHLKTEFKNNNKPVFSVIGCLAVITVCLMIPGQARSQDQAGEQEDVEVPSYTMEESIDRALEENPRIRAAESEVSKAESAVGTSRSEYFPTLSLQSYTQSLNSVRAKGPTDEDYIDQQVNVAGIRLSQTLFEGFTVFNRHQRAVLQKELAEAEKSMAEKDMVLEIQERFLELLKAREDVESLKDSVNRLEVNLEAAKAFSERQMLPYSEVLQARVDLEDARQELSQAENKVETMRGELNIFLGFPPEQKVNYRGELARGEDFEFTMPECIDIAYQHRPEILIAKKSIKMAEKEKAVAEGGYSPRLSADADYYYRDKDYDEPGTSMGQTYDRDQTNTHWSVTLRLDWEFDLGGGQVYRNREAFHELERLRRQRKDTRNRVAAQVRTKYLNLREADGRIESTNEAVKAAREAYSRSEKRFRVNIGTISELLDAQARLSRAESNHHQAVADYMLSLAGLNRAMGKKDRSLGRGE